MKESKLDIAKNLFYKYDGSYYNMLHDDVYAYYKTFDISKELEKQWRTEKVESLKKDMSLICNNKEFSKKFNLLCMYIVQLRNTQELYLLLNNVKNNAIKYDSNTIFRNINSLLNSLSILYNRTEKEKFIISCISILNSILENGIVISKDYMENGVFPEYLTVEKLSLNIQNAINYYMKLIES